MRRVLPYGESSFSNAVEESSVKWNVALAVCCAVLLPVNLALIRQNRQLKAQIGLPPKMEAEIGAHVPELRGIDLGGNP